MKNKGKITLILAALMIAAGIFFYKHYQQQQKLEYERMEAYNVSVRNEEEKRYARLEAERIAEEREQKRLYDSTAIAERHPFTDEELIAMVKKFAPSYSDIMVYRRSKTDWIMLYLREANFKQHFYIRQFNPVKRQFGNEQELIYYFDSKKNYDACLKKEPHSEIIIDTSRIEIKSSKLNGIWNHDWTNVKIIEASTKSPSQIREERQQRKQRKYRYYYDDDEDDDEEREHEEYDEDCPENNELDINLYYNPKYKPK